MACAGLLLVMFAAAALQLPDAVRPLPSQPPSSEPGRHIDLSLPERIHNPAMPMSGMVLSSPQSEAAEAALATAVHPGISFGPFRTDFGGTTGRHMHLATVRLEGVSVFGGSIGGSIDSRSARITLSWHTGN